MTDLFQLGEFTLASGQTSKFKIECDALTPGDWEGLAYMASTKLRPFSEVHGVPRGGVPFATALEKYITPGANRILIAEDVVTTGGSIKKFLSTFDRKGNDVSIVCVFSRGTVDLTDDFRTLFVMS